MHARPQMGSVERDRENRQKERIMVLFSRGGKVRQAYKQICDHGTKPGQISSCKEHTYVTTKASNKYAQVRFEGWKYYVHIIACMVGCEVAPLPGLEASHRCGNPRCITPEHLVFEDGDTNKSRLCCHKYLGVHPRYVCPHEPCCIVV